MKKSETQKDKLVSQEFLVEQFQHFEKRILKTVDTYIESRVDYARKDMREFTRSEGEGLKKKIDELKGNMSRLESNLQTTWNAVKETKNEVIAVQKKLEEHDRRFDRLEEKLDRVAEKADRHDEDIAFLKSAVSPT